ncbi:GMC family oxidoreductase [Dasania sp. GY-MA-18]|uniref:GMC family oxidoreductase n=1 Tax=Dasania phycosphaerae TaxID=2950436 RepID=A0A9J6RQA3_9GAMM|nr:MULTISPECIES: GMC family oxidoreductase [Dasania]MCR8924111.1 GMC family oxidoreductase [Dasania sp. GY-MA-18]MCZ0866684.1 GMC family oxidoreductase [Dasania phycosphaerae]MCZ0870269.1 GMC family oxidoreductase [Dasania phycosphaerae]
MIIDGLKIGEEVKTECELCIVGGGVAGIVLANELSSAFSSIVVIESGSQDYNAQAQELYEAESQHEQIPNPLYSRLRMLGGSSNHWENNTSPFSPLDFEKRDWIKNSGWPLGFEELSDYYKKAGWYCGVGDDGYDQNYWSKKLEKNDLAAGSQVLKTQISKYAVPPVRFFQQHGDVLINSNNITVYTGLNLVDIIYNKNNKDVELAKAINTGGNELSVSAKIFIFCLGGIENARMMLVFNDKYDNQLGNQGDSVGRYFMEHPTPRAAQLLADSPERYSFYLGEETGDKLVAGYFSLEESVVRSEQTTNLRMPLHPSTEYMLSDGISSYHILSDAIAKGDVPENFGQHLLNLTADIDLVAEAVSRKKFQKSLFDYSKNFAGFQMPMMMEQTPHRDNRIRLGSKKDKMGISKLKIDWELKESDKAMVWKTLELAANEIGALDIGRMRLLYERASRIWGDQLGFSQHHMGTTRMAENPDNGVVDKYHRVFGTNNLFMGGSSVFSTGGHVAPTLTIVAMTIRLADYIKREYAHD